MKYVHTELDLPTVGYGHCWLTATNNSIIVGNAYNKFSVDSHFVKYQICQQQRRANWYYLQDIEKGMPLVH